MIVFRSPCLPVKFDSDPPLTFHEARTSRMTEYESKKLKELSERALYANRSYQHALKTHVENLEKELQHLDQLIA
jgi:polyhydroxyalkanoate synthesis regulator phasin